jgi:succinate dehydrogenase/fumarate reductase flavoprotein subunit
MEVRVMEKKGISRRESLKNTGEGTQGASPLTECLVFGKITAEKAATEMN